MDRGSLVLCGLLEGCRTSQTFLQGFLEYSVMVASLESMVSVPVTVLFTKLVSLEESAQRWILLTTSVRKPP